MAVAVKSDSLVNNKDSLGSYIKVEDDNIAVNSCCNCLFKSCIVEAANNRSLANNHGNYLLSEQYLAAGAAMCAFGKTCGVKSRSNGLILNNGVAEC